ncbi:MAG: nucleoside deaminase [Candidatus Bostrichicola ureolyticus]|nr:MAG: nucleoside deaminase [Candidatus Bostrichicola ureolyticus]WGH27460.1 MAG: nucleoside deaminase [Candidatus Bostrichicola ureolyticus]
MKKALNQAINAFHKNEVPIGAIITHNNIIIAKSHNLIETLNNVTAHAEMQVIKIASNKLGIKYLKGCTLYVTLEPCIMCSGALYLSQISRIVFGAIDYKIGFSKMKIKLHPKTIYKSGIMSKESILLLQQFFKKKRK